MVLAYYADRWLEQQEKKHQAAQAAVRERMWEEIGEWLSRLGLPAIDEITEHGTSSFTPEQRQAADHAIDVLTHKRCTDPACPYHDDAVPDFLNG